MCGKAWLRYIKRFGVLLLAGLMALGLNAETVFREETPVVDNTPLELGSLILGSQMPDFIFTDADGEQYRLYEILREKELVVLNFWFATCYYCALEFPAMEKNYEAYKESVEILALNPYDDVQTIRYFRENYGLTFPMGEDVRELRKAFCVTGYPTSVFIDRNGVVCLIENGAIPYESLFAKAFAYFTAEDYTLRLFQSIWNIP